MHSLVLHLKTQLDYKFVHTSDHMQWQYSVHAVCRQYIIKNTSRAKNDPMKHSVALTGLTAYS